MDTRKHILRASKRKTNSICKYSERAKRQHWYCHELHVVWTYYQFNSKQVSSWKSSSLLLALVNFFILQWIGIFSTSSIHASTCIYKSISICQLVNLKYNAGSWTPSYLEDILKKWKKFWDLLYLNFQEMTWINWGRDWILSAWIITPVTTFKIASCLCVNLEKEARGQKVPLY